ncbi:hypothetical protein [Sabulicella rubraurantiaca]|uniref:hypothetical protein n=1 Tax=Sabulicella rubraurantiaca TaxID=2811429 RepID=UPI001A964304|nr:hypothetical protein [Sabulicella rubraurantiaca]
MSGNKSFHDYGVLPSALIWDGGLLFIPLWVVSEITLEQTFHLPPIGSAGMRAIAPVKDATLRLRGLLVGPERYAWKLALETQAEAAQRGTAAAALTNALAGAVGAPGLAAGGLVVATSMTIRTDMQVKQLTFAATSARREALDVSLTLEHVPRPSPLGKLLDVAAIGVGALADFG